MSRYILRALSKHTNLVSCSNFGLNSVYNRNEISTVFVTFLVYDYHYISFKHGRNIVEKFYKSQSLKIINVRGQEIGNSQKACDFEYFILNKYLTKLFFSMKL
ncbi:hypothetical protein BpHYR1_018898 [Brachionus plicatilis]|uniref:Uncharacterized protein n=1 Tax=Brachionus plicatilis TaxID=10195 RepID=A0A3M7SMT4_BRAPC|nr:hypothetical protein BpHYR1_018898 [Brachionus plicatilis]